MKKFFDQKGISLVMVIVSIALVGIGTTVIMNLNKKNTVQYSRARATNFAEIERRRVAAILADTVACESNFKGQNYFNNDILKLITKNSDTVVAKNSWYFNTDINGNNGSLKLTNITSRLDPNTTQTGDKRYEIVLTYLNDVMPPPAPPSTTKQLTTAGKTQTQIHIPMYFKLDVSGNVVTCFAMSETYDVDTAIAAACSPSTPPTKTLRKSDLVMNNGSIANCQNNITFETNNTQIGSDIYTRGGFTDCGPTKFLTGIEILAGTSVGGYGLKFSSAGVCTLPSANCASGQSGYTFSSSSLTCDYAGNTRDSDGGSAVCSTDQIIWRNGASSTTCVSVACLGTYNFINKVTTAGASCFTAPTTSCGADQYVSQFNESGVDQCSPLPIINGSCSPGGFGTGLTRTTPTSGGTLACGTFNVAKSCAIAPTTFAYSLAPTSIACNTF